MRVFVYFLLLCCAGFAEAESVEKLSNGEVLERADEIRISDRAEAEYLLGLVDEERLSKNEKVFYEYLKTVTGSFNGDVKHASQMYKQLLDIVDDDELRIRIEASYLNLLGALGRWKEGLALGETLLNDIANITTSQTIYRAYLGLIAFYDQLQQPETVLNLTGKVIGKEGVPPEVECGVQTARIGALVKLTDKSFTLEELHSASQFCLENNLTIYYAVLEMYKITWMINQGMFQESLPFLEELLENAQVQEFTPHLMMVLARYAEVNMNLGNISTARSAALNVLKLDPGQNYREAIIKALEVLNVIARDHGEIADAYDYLQKLTSLQKVESLDRQERQLAIQKAWFELDAMQNENYLLDKQNALLQARAQLVKENYENSILALILVTLIMASLLYWSFRTHKLQTKLKHVARTDALTGVANRGYFTECAIKAIEQSRAQNSLISFIVVDLDHFKNINDNYGHLIGDAVLKLTADTLVQTMGDIGVLGRLGGEEFGTVLVGKTQREVLLLTEQCRNKLANVQFPVSGYQISITASFGISNSSEAGYSFENLYAAADLALFKSKRCGRNSVNEYTSSMKSEK